MNIIQNKPINKITINDLVIKESLGKGKFGEVFLTYKKNSNKKYALKVINKYYISKYDKKHYAIMEKYILENLKYKKLVKLYSTFQDNSNLYFLMEYVPKGTLSRYIKFKGKLDIEEVRYLTSEILKLLIFFRKYGIVYRDLKAENILLTKNMNIKFIDFGTCKILENNNNINIINYLKKFNVNYGSDNKNFWDRESLAGSPYYVAPEIYEKSIIDFSNDYWSLGILVYKMIHGKFPVNNNFSSFGKVSNNIEYESSLEKDAINFIKNLLVIDPSKRLGTYNKTDILSFNNLINHPFLGKYKLNLKNKIIKSPLNYNNNIKITQNFIKKKCYSNSWVNNINKLILFEGIIEIQKFKIFKLKRYCKFYSDGSIFIYSKNKLKLKNKFFISTKTDIILKNSYTILISNSFLNKIQIYIKNKNILYFWDSLQQTKKKFYKKRSMHI